MDAAIHIITGEKFKHPRLIWNEPHGADEECWLLKEVGTNRDFKNFKPIHPNDAMGILESVVSKMSEVIMVPSGRWVNRSQDVGGFAFPTAVQALAYKYGWKPPKS